jgi:hypothetical protein
MTKDLLRDTAIARALVILITNPDNVIDDPDVRSGFESVINAIGEQVEKASQAEGDRQVELLEAMRAHAADVFEATDDETREAAMETLARDFDLFTSTIPGYQANGSAPAVMPAPQTT